jgi:multidrug efflux pump subunit AcrB
VGQFREGDKLIDIVMRPPKQDRDAITDIAGVYVTTANGQSIPLTQIAKPVMVWEPGVMWREKRNFAITVQGDVREGLQGATLTNELLPQLRKMEAGWHAAGDTGYRIEVAGAVEESSKGSGHRGRSPGAAVPDLHAAHAAAAQLQPFAAGVPHRAAGHSGVAAALLLLNRPFGFVALLGLSR